MLLILLFLNFSDAVMGWGCQWVDEHFWVKASWSDATLSNSSARSNSSFRM
jgi:hypothetical protein